MRVTTPMCFECGKGQYKETSLHDDREGELHCSACNHAVKRWTKVGKPKKK
jgi:hypothetical protein